jgi:hypothetical protein
MKRISWLAMLSVGVLALSVVAANAQLRRPIKAVALHDRECVKECRGDLDECLEAAADDLSECVEPCADERAAARAACADDPSRTACAEARAALRACVAPCLEVYDPAITACFGEARECVGECPPVDDPPCVRACFAERAECFADLRAEVKACRDRCRAEVAAARRICSDDPDSEECRAATAAARLCLAPCGELLRKGVRECRRETRACLALCDDEEEPAGDAAQ